MLFALHNKKPRVMNPSSVFSVLHVVSFSQGVHSWFDRVHISRDGDLLNELKSFKNGRLAVENHFVEIHAAWKFEHRLTFRARRYSTPTVTRADTRQTGHAGVLQ